MAAMIEVVVSSQQKTTGEARRALWDAGKVESSEPAQRFNLRGKFCGEGQQSLHSLERSEVAGQQGRNGAEKGEVFEGWAGCQSMSSKSSSQVHRNACLSRNATSMVGLEVPPSIRWR